MHEKRHAQIQLALENSLIFRFTSLSLKKYSSNLKPGTSDPLSLLGNVHRAERHAHIPMGASTSIHVLFTYWAPDYYERVARRKPREWVNSNTIA
jgi:hypothetical protein